MLKTFLRLFFFISFCMLLSATNALAADKNLFSMEPTTNNGKKWRIAYYEGGPYIDYQQIFTETIRGLISLGWIEATQLPEQNGEETKTLWKWLVNEANSDYLEFVEDGHYSGDWLNQLQTKTVNQVINRLRDTKDIDLLIAMGTAAGQAFANNKHNTPTLVLSASDPLASGIIKSVEDSGFDHIHATLDPKRYERQVRVFHEIIGFKRLGIFYENSVNGRSYAAIDLVEKVAKERDFEIVRCHSLGESVDNAEAWDKSVTKCFRELGGKVDAIYVTVQGGVNNNTIPKLVELGNEYRIPTFSQSGSSEVKYGFLLSISQAGFKYVGEFHAQTIAKVFNGAKPNQLEQLFEEPPKIAINLKTAELIGFDPPIVLLGAADEIFHEIVNPGQ